MVAEVQEEPISEELEQPSETDQPDPEDSKPSLEELLSDPEALASVLNHPSVSQKIAEEAKKAEDRGRNRTLAEQRRRFADPEAVEAALFDILSEAGLGKDSVSRSMRERAQTLFSTASRAVADRIAEEIPGFFFGDFKFEQDTIAAYQEAMGRGDTDTALRTLVDGAVAQKAKEAEADFDKRVKAEVDKRVKAELESAGEDVKPPPATSRGTPSGGGSMALTSAEIERIPASVWKRLPNEVKTTLYRNVGSADEQRAGKVDQARLERVLALAE